MASAVCAISVVRGAIAFMATGGAIGPDLSYVGDARPDREWHVKHFRDPQSVSPGSIMPKFPLTEAELNDLTSYMLSLKRTT